jgi:hypothetical protein
MGLRIGVAYELGPVLPGKLSFVQGIGGLLRRRDRFSISSFQLADLGGKANYCYRDQLQTWGAAAIPFHAAVVTRAS